MNLYDLPCIAEGCDRTLKHSSSELCGRCYQRVYKTGNRPVLSPCVVEGCKSNESFRGACVKHRAEVHPEVRFPRRVGKWQNPDGSRKTCTAEDCQGGAEARGLCGEHYSRSVYIPKGRSNTPGGIRIKCTWSDEPCDQDATVRKMCNRHSKQRDYLEANKGLPAFVTCPVNGCSRRMSRGSKICKRCNQFRWRYSFTVDDVLRLHHPVNRFCRNTGCGSSEDLHMDHDHSCCPREKFGTSHKVSCGLCNRGWLCKGCNNSLGMLQENPRRIQGLLDYLADWRGYAGTS